MLNIEGIFKDGLFFCIFERNGKFWAANRLDGEVDRWEMRIFGMDFHSFKRVSECKRLVSKYLKIDKQGRRMAYANGLCGGGCFGSKNKVIETKSLRKELSSSEERGEEIKFKKGTNLSNDMRIEDEIQEAAENIVKDLEFGIFNRKCLKKVYRSESLASSNPQKVFITLFKGLSNTELFKNIEMIQNQSQYFFALKNYLIASLCAMQQLSQTPDLSNLTSLNYYYQQKNKFSSYLHPLINSAIILAILKSQSSSELSKILHKSISTNTIPKLPEEFLYIKYFLFTLIPQNNLKNSETIEKELNLALKGIKTSNYLDIFEILQTCYYLSKNKFLKSDFLFSQFLNISGLLENQDTIIRQVAINCLRKWKKCGNLNLVEGIRALFAQIFNQDDNLVIKAEICSGFEENLQKDLDKEVTLNVELKYLPRISGRANDLNKICSGLEEKQYFGIFGESGTGRTVLALYYAKIYKNQYSIIWFINSEQPILDLLGLMEALKIESKFSNLNVLIEYLQNPSIDRKILLVFDNCDYLNKIDKYLLKNSKVHILLITRTEVWKNSINLNEIDDEVHNITIQSLYPGVLDEETMLNFRKVFRTRFLHLKLLGVFGNSESQVIADESVSLNSLIQPFFFGFLSTLPNHTQFLIEILSYLDPYKISEAIIKQAFLKNFNEKNWKQSKSVLISKGLIKIQETSDKYWSINGCIYSLFNDCKKSLDAEKTLEGLFSSIYLPSQNPEKFNELTFQVLSFIYQTNLNTIKILEIGILVTENLLLIKYQINEILDLLTIFEENCIKLIQNNETDAVKFLKIISKLFENCGEDFEALRVLMEYHQEITKLNLEDFENIIYTADLAARIGEFECADLLYSEAQEKYSQQVIKNPEIFYSNYANLLIKQKNMQKAEKIVKIGLKISKQSQNSYLLLNTLALIRKSEKNYLKARKSLLKSKSLLESFQETNSLEYSNILLELGKIHIKCSEYSPAQDLILKSFEISSNILTSLHLDLLYPLAQLAKIGKLTNNESLLNGIVHEYYKNILLILNNFYTICNDLSELDLSEFYTSPFLYKQSERKLKKGLKVLQTLYPNPSN